MDAALHHFLGHNSEQNFSNLSVSLAHSIHFKAWTSEKVTLVQLLQGLWYHATYWKIKVQCSSKPFYWKWFKISLWFPEESSIFFSEFNRCMERKPPPRLEITQHVHYLRLMISKNILLVNALKLYVASHTQLFALEYAWNHIIWYITLGEKCPFKASGFSLVWSTPLHTAI